MAQEEYRRQSLSEVGNDMSAEQGEPTNTPQDVKHVGCLGKINNWAKDYKETVSLGGVIVALIGVVGAVVALYFLFSQTDSLRKQTDIIGNQTSYLAEQTQILQTDYENRTRPYLAIEGVAVRPGNSSENLDILIEIENRGSLPITRLYLGNVSKGEPGIIIGGRDLSYNKSTGEFSATYQGECVKSSSSQSSESLPPENTGGAIAQIRITLTPCYIAPLRKTDFPEDLIFYPGKRGYMTVSVLKSTYEKTCEESNVMQIGLLYYYEGTKYYYIATLNKTADGSWVTEAIGRGN